MENPYSAPSDPGKLPPVAGTAGRPTTATVFGILNLVFSILGMCTSIAGGGFVLWLMFGEVPADFGDMQDLREPVNRTWMVFSLASGTVLNVLLLAAGIGLMRFRAWGRTLSNAYCVLSILLVAATFAFTILVSLVPAINSMDQGGAEQAGTIGGIIGGLVGNCIGLIYPALMLFFLNKNPFKQQILAQAGNRPRNY